MEVVVFSDSNTMRSCFGAVERSRKHAVRYESLQDLSQWLRNGHHRGLVYVDVTGMSAAARTRLLRRLSRHDRVVYSVIDPRNQVIDPAALLRNGAVDYVNRSVYSAGITCKRVDEISAFVKSAHPDLPAPAAAKEAGPLPGSADGRRLIVSGEDWNRVQLSREYTFLMLFAELDNAFDYTNRTSERYTTSLVNSFQRLLEEATAAYHGRVWMWREFGGIMLFPFSGGSCPAVLACVRMILSRPLDNIEKFDLKTGLSYRLSLHLGNTVYRPKGDTGYIVSDSVNFIHHLGQRFTMPGNFTLTGPVYHMTDTSLRPLFKPAGEFEGRSVYRMRLPVKPK